MDTDSDKLMYKNPEMKAELPESEYVKVKLEHSYRLELLT